MISNIVEFFKCLLTGSFILLATLLVMGAIAWASAYPEVGVVAVLTIISLFVGWKVRSERGKNDL